jgi:hypothetical protein
LHTCVVADPESKGGSEATVRIAKADPLPRETNQRSDLGVVSFALEDVGHLMLRHRIDDSGARAVTRINRADLICIDGIGLLPTSPDAVEGFFTCAQRRGHRRRLRAAQPGDQQQPAPQQLRHHHAQDRRCRRRAPALASCPGPIRRRGFVPTERSHGWEGGDPPQRVAGENPWLPVGSTHGHQRGLQLATGGENRWPPAGRSTAMSWENPKAIDSAGNRDHR